MMPLAIEALVAFLIALVATPVCRTVCHRFGWVDQPDSRKLHRSATPRTGGIAIVLGYAAAICTHHAWTMLPAVVVAFSTGLLDDLVNVKPVTKVAGQVLAALFAYAAGIRIHVGGPWDMPLTVVWLIGCANAVNLIDGLDGLAAGIGWFATAAAFVSALVTGNVTLALATAPLLGALLGFLPYNLQPASIFMGDCGSNTIGFLLGCFTILWSQSGPAIPASVAPVIALALPLLDTALAIFRRYLRKEPIFAADRGHIHHRLLARGFHPRAVACILYAGAGFFALLAVLLSTATFTSGPVLGAFGIVIWLALRYLRYDEFDTVRRVVFSGALREILSSDLEVRKLGSLIASAGSIDECWRAIQSGAPTLGLCRVSAQLHDRTYSAQVAERETADGCWSLRVPLDGAGTIELEFPFGASPAAGAPLADLLRTVLAPKLQALRPQLAFAAAAGRNSYRRW